MADMGGSAQVTPTHSADASGARPEPVVMHLLAVTTG